MGVDPRYNVPMSVPPYRKIFITPSVELYRVINPEKWKIRDETAATKKQVAEAERAKRNEEKKIQKEKKLEEDKLFEEDRLKNAKVAPKFVKTKARADREAKEDEIRKEQEIKRQQTELPGNSSGKKEIKVKVRKRLGK